MRFHDHHFHPLGYVSMVTGLELSDTTDFADLVSRIERAAASTDGAVIGQRLNDESLRETSLPDRHVLDQAESRRPVLVYRYCGHIGIANSRALALAGVDRTTADPEGGSFDRDESGEPTGVLRESALQVVSDALSSHTSGPSQDEIIAAFESLTELGIESVTGMVSAGEPMWCGVGNELSTLISVAPELPIDIGVIVITESADQLVDAAEQLAAAPGNLQFGGWKEFADGSLGGHTAAMYEPFFDKPNQLGVLRLRPGHVESMARLALELGGDVAIHAIGDRANDEVADFYEHMIGQGAEPGRLRVEHASVVTDSTLRRFADLGVTLSVQPAFLASEEEWLEKRLGPDRMRLAYRFRSMAEAGIKLLGGSDCPVEPPDPRTGIEAAVARHGINPEEALTRAQAEDLFRAPG